MSLQTFAFSVLTPLVGRQEGHPAFKTLEWRGAGVVMCPERGADLHMSQLMLLPLTVSCFSKIQIGFILLVSAHLGSPGQRAIKQVCVCVCRLTWSMVLSMAGCCDAGAQKRRITNCCLSKSTTNCVDKQAGHPRPSSAAHLWT